MRVALATLLASLAAAAPASAGEISVGGGVLRIAGGNGFVDADVRQDGASFVVDDYGQSLEPGAGCRTEVPEVVGPIGDRRITCTGVTAAVEATVGGEGNFLMITSDLPKRLRGGDGVDTMIGNGAGQTIALGGPGDDYLSGGSGDDRLEGGPGDDGLRGGAGVDTALGGEDDDFLQGDGSGCCAEPTADLPPPAGTADVLDGGPGSDRFAEIEPADRLSGGDGRDTASFFGNGALDLTLGAGGLDVENVSVELADATVRGDGRANEIVTGEGKDAIDAGAGFDKVITGRGDDTVTVRDGFPDYVDCGEGADRVVAEPADEVDASCEVVERADLPAAAPGTPAAPSAIAPSDLKVSARRKGRRVTLRGRLVLPAGASTSLCKGGGVTLEVRGLRKRLVRHGTVLDGRCAFSVKLKAKVRRRIRVKAYFAGTPAVAPIGS